MPDQSLLDIQTQKAQEIFGDIVFAVTDYEEHEGSEAGVDLIWPPEKIADDDGITIEFVNGRKVRFSTSEWAYISIPNS